METFKYEIIYIQEWNNNKERHLSYHKTLEAAEKMLIISEREEIKSRKRTKEKIGNRYRIQTL